MKEGRAAGLRYQFVVVVAARRPAPHPRLVLKAGPAQIPPIGVKLLNEREVTDRLGAQTAALVRARARTGRGPNGPLPRNQAGTTPWYRTGGLAGSIGYVLTQDGKQGWIATVRPLGRISPAPTRARSNRGAKVAAALGAPLRVRVRKPAAVTKGNRVTTYAGLAAALAAPDKRKGSRRAIYRVVAPSVNEQKQAAELAQKLLKAELEKTK